MPRYNTPKHLLKKNSYRIWIQMRQRCNNPTVTGYEYYGGKGIKVCDRWLLFENFYTNMGDKPKGKTLDRVNNDGNYEKSNCEWATSTQQYHNRRV